MPATFEEASAPEPDPPPYAEPEPEHETQPEPELPPAAAVPDDRDALIESLRDRVDAQEQEIAVLREQLEQEQAQKDVQVHVWPEEQPSPEQPAPSQPENYLLCVPTSAGYVLLDRVGALPRVGEAVAVPEQEGNFTVAKVVRLPRNGRPCAYLQRA
jgi:DamX protein